MVLKTQESEAESVPGGPTILPPLSVWSASKVRQQLDGLEPGERVDAHVLIIPTAGQGSHTIDFLAHDVRPGLAFHIQPGQVQEWDPDATFAATVVTAGPELCPPGLFSVAEPRPEVDLGPTADVVAAVAADLIRESAAPEPDRFVLLASTVLLLHHVALAGSRGDEPVPAAQAEVLRLFRAELESCYTVTRSVSDYARRIGTSTKTLSRATTGLTGASPKELIDQRVVLEARRLLAHSTDSASMIGTTLGFSEPTNFTKFFARHTGLSPQEFRAGG
ncbi:MAG: helix-turn-helix domain-containing protein [Actinomycetota bacterium]